MSANKKTQNEVQTKTSNQTSPSKVINLAEYRSQRAIVAQQVAPVVQPQESDVQIIRDQAKITCEFNVMPDRPVRENFYVKEYRIGNLYGEATFDRDYFSSMEKSPDHLVLFTAQAHTQKVIYLVLAKYFGHAYSPEAKEVLKIWPTEVTVRMPRMVRDNTDVIQKLWITEITALKDGVYEIKVRTSYNDTVEIDVAAKVYLIAK